jgi:hypothetical protein
MTNSAQDGCSSESEHVRDLIRDDEKLVLASSILDFL